MGRRARWGVRVVMVAAGLLGLAGGAAGEAEVYIGTSQTPMPALPAQIAQPRQPVLFVHGHNLASPTDADFNYRKNFHDDPAGALTAFQATLDAPANAWLGLEPYYVRFQDQHRSIVEDARDIADAVERILHRHDPTHTPGMASPTTPVRVAIVAYSKGTISARLYLKSLHQQVFDLPAPRPGFNPISELVALSPPNHGLNVPVNPLGDNTAAKQLNNGYGGPTCLALPGAGADVLDFIQQLNGHPIGDTMAEPFGNPQLHHLEAPGSRPSGAPFAAGTLYATLYADGARDFVGGSHPSSDCQGRVVAANLAPDAVNREVPAIPGTSATEVHQNTVHTPEVICRALATVVHHRAPAADFGCALAGEVPRVPPRTAVALVLDFSGSMLAPASPGGAQKLTVLKEAVEIFSELYAAFAGPGDRLGAAFFGTQPSEFSLGGEALLPVTDVNVDAVVQAVTGRQTAPGEATAMGGGLGAAIARLASPAAAGAAARHVVLFTDGMQNVPPLVSPPPPPLAIATTPPTPLDAALGIAIHTIGVGAASPFVALLAEIAAQTGGTQKITIAADQDLRAFFVQTLVEALEGNSPQLVDYRRGAFAGAPVEERFTLGAGARRLALKLSWRGRAALGFTVAKDGADLTALGRFVQGPFYRIFVMDLPGRVAASAGTWTMRIAGDGSVAYEVAALVDEPRLGLRAALVRRAVRAGEPLDLRVTLALDGRRLAAPVTVRARVFRPGESAGNLLARSATPAGGPDLEGADPAQRKLARLLADPEQWRRLQPVASVIELRPAAAGVYAGAFGATEVPGLYRVEVEVEGDTPRTGPVRRRHTLVALVRLGRPEAGASAIRVTEVGRAGGERTLELAVRPRDGLGNFLGPGWGSGVALTLDGKPLEAAPRDELDGTYVLPLAVPVGADPPITLAVDGETLYAGPLSGAGRAGPGARGWAALGLLALLVLLAAVVAWRGLGRLARP